MGVALLCHVLQRTVRVVVGGGILPRCLRGRVASQTGRFRSFATPRRPTFPARPTGGGVSVEVRVASTWRRGGGAEGGVGGGRGDVALLVWNK